MKTLSVEKKTKEIPVGEMVNGVNVSQLFTTVAAINGSPGLARFNFRAENKWINGGHNRTTIQGFYGVGEEDTSRSEPMILDSDEPSVLLGEDNGASPVEFVLHALAACLTTSLIYNAAAKGIQIDEVESRLEGNLDLRGFLGLSDGVRNGYEDICVTFRIKADAPVERLQELCEMAQRRSPVFDIVSNSVPVMVALEKQ